MAGQHSAQTAARVEDLLGVGCGLWDIARAVGLKPDSIVRALQRSERHDLASTITAMITADKERATSCLRSAA